MGNANVNQTVGRKQVRQTLYNFINPPQVDGINQVFTSLPKRINFQENALPSQQSRTAAVIFIESENETRIALGGFNGTDGGIHAGWKRIDYSVVIQLFQHSLARTAEEAMDDFDNVIDNLKNRLRSDHTLGDPSGILVWQGAEPIIDVAYGEPLSQNGTSTETWASMRFTVTQMIQA
jgi:hypothetical protein